jgi:LacI family transcriptional regulator
MYTRKRFRVENFYKISYFKGFIAINKKYFYLYFENVKLMKRKVTLKQIAKELDVSISTVSKSLRNSPEISEDTRQKVQAFAKLYNYKPNNIALSLKEQENQDYRHHHSRDRAPFFCNGHQWN